MSEYKRIEENIWRKFGQNLLKNKRSDEQRIFLEACRDGRDNFLTYLNENLFNKENAIIEGKAINIKHKLSEAQFCFPPEDTQKIIWDVFTDVAQEDMMSCGFWGNIIINMIHSNFIKPEFLAVNLKGVNGKGCEVLDKVLKASDNADIIDSCVRRILRSMCNPAPRDKRIMFNDFSLGKSYWRWNWAHKMSNEIDLDYKEILKIFDETSYADFAGKMHSGKSYISQTNTLGGLLLFLNSSQTQRKN